MNDGMSRYLMCSPADYHKALPEHGVDPKRAESQWQAIYDWLASKAAVDLMDPIKGLTDLVFAAKAGFITNGYFIKSRFRRRMRRETEIEIERWFRKKNYDVKTVPEPYFFEGEGDLVSVGPEIFAGYHFRSELESYEYIAVLMKRDPLFLQIRDTRFSHLESCLGPLDDQTALVFKDAFDPYAYLTLLETVPNVIQVPEEEALRFVCNSLCVGKKVLMPLGCSTTRILLEDRGFEVTELDSSEYLKAGSAAKSLVLKL